MNKQDAYSMYEMIRAYYSFFLQKDVFADIYETEFKDIPAEWVKRAIKDYCKNPYNKVAPAVNDIKNRLTRYIWISEYKLFENTENIRFNKEKAGTTESLEYIDEDGVMHKTIIEYEEKPILTDSQIQRLNNMIDVLKKGLGEYYEQF